MYYIILILFMMYTTLYISDGITSLVLKLNFHQFHVVKFQFMEIIAFAHP